MIARVTKQLALVLGLTALIGYGVFSRGQDAPSPLVGKTAPDLSLKTLDGKDVKLSDQKGSVVLMDFWATWCPPCKASLPHVQKLSADKDRAAKGLKVWAVNSQEEAATVQKFVTANSYNFAVPMASGEDMQKYNIEGIPTTVVVGRDGKVKNLFVGYGGEESDKQIEDAIDAALKDGPVQ